MMSRRTLLKLVALLPWAGPLIAKALAKSSFPSKRVYAPYLPTTFPEWNRAIDGLSDAGKWAMDIERSRLPAGLVLPRVGQIWVAVRDCQVAFRASFDYHAAQADPATAFRDFARVFGSAQLREGERIRVLGVDDPNQPLRVTFQPIRYKELDEHIVPEDTRKSPGYCGYELSAKTARTIGDFGKQACSTYFNEAFRLVEDAA